MNQIAKYVTPGMVEKMLGLPGGAIDSFAFLVMQEMAKGVEVERIAKELQVDESELDLLADSVTGGPNGLKHDLWKAGVVTIRSINLANQHVMGQGWDALEAMAVNRLAQAVQDSGERLSLKDAASIAQLANKAVRRGNGEGPRNPGLMTRPPSGGGEEMTLNIQGGNLGSIRLSLSARVQSQLEQPRTVDAVPVERRMLTIEEIRNVKSERDS